MTTNRNIVLMGLLLTGAVLTGCGSKQPAAVEKDFLRVEGKDIVDSKGNKFYIKGTNLGNWLNPEGYMFGFSKINSPRLINEAICQLVGPSKAKEFWQNFKDSYITEADFSFIVAEGANTVRVPFHYKLFTNEDYMGLNDAEEGFRRLDSCVSWAKRNNLRLILDMHDCPGGQTGDNIDDSYGYPWLMTDTVAQNQFVSIWGDIAARYADEDVILGYELANEPVATYWEGEERDKLNAALEPLYKKAVAEIRKNDKNHIVLLGGPQWNSYFGNFTDWKFDDNIMYTCHRYGGPATKEAIDSYISFRDSVGLPMYMGEIGHNTDEWMNDFVKVMRENNIGYTFWPYKKINDSSMTGVKAPEGWERVVAFVEAPRGSYKEIREARALCSQEAADSMLNQFVDNATAARMLKHRNYINAIDLKK